MSIENIKKFKQKENNKTKDKQKKNDTENNTESKAQNIFCFYVKNREWSLFVKVSRGSCVNILTEEATFFVFPPTIFQVARNHFTDLHEWTGSQRQ